MKTRQLAPDFIKGVAIVLMVYGHLTMIGNCADTQNCVKSWIYSFHMPLFLLISGMFFSSEGEFFKKFNKILLRVGVPYVLFISVYLMGLKLIQNFGIPTSNAPPESIGDFLKTVIFFPRGGYWFLHSLLLIQLALVLGRACVGSKGPASILLFTALLLLILTAFGLVRGRTIVYFLIGMTIQSVTGRELKVSFLFGIAGVAVVWALDYFLKLNAIAHFSLTEVVWCLSILFGLWSFSEQFPGGRGVRLIAWIGRNSLSILVFHAIFIVLLKPAGGFFIRVDSSGWLYSIGATLMTTALSLFSAFALDKIRLSRYLFGTPQCYMPLGQGAEGVKKGEDP
ncbi:acyltransferase family protein [Pontiellaceae bacterium B12227]|nr:acyltransferase family protein [Pontiellaceae bacterium B12227]